MVEASPSPVLGEAGPERFVVRENGMRFELSHQEGYSTGLFLDQRENRHRLLTGHIAAGFSLFDQSHLREGPRGEVLNTFAYTCGFSLCAARAGCRTTSVDLSKKYLEWGKRNFALNEMDSSEHDFLNGDAFEWLRRLAKKGRQFMMILLDPPTFSSSKDSGVFRAEKDYGKLVSAALPLLASGGILFASSNAAGWRPEDFVATLETTMAKARRKVLERQYAPQPPDFPISRSEPGYLKTAWLRVA
jgi:23S rRNA (cytosine1962-C5)-methyltransferase